MLFLYLCIPILKVGLKKILPFDEEICTYIVLAAIFTLYVILCVQERRIISRDFWRLYLFLVILFWGAYILHPNYKHWYDRAEYGVWDYVLRPDNGLFIYLFIRLIEDPDEILKTIKVSGWVMYLYFGRAVMKALKLGYWIDTSNYGYINSVASRYSFPIIGVLPARNTRWFAKSIGMLEGEPESNFETAGKTTAQTLFSIIGDRKVALVSSEGSSIIDSVIPFLDNRIATCGNILSDASAVKSAMEYDGLVLVEERDKSRFDKIDTEVRRIDSIGKKIEGIILL